MTCAWWTFEDKVLANYKRSDAYSSKREFPSLLIVRHSEKRFVLETSFGIALFILPWLFLLRDTEPGTLLGVTVFSLLGLAIVAFSRQKRIDHQYDFTQEGIRFGDILLRWSSIVKVQRIMPKENRRHIYLRLITNDGNYDLHLSHELNVKHQLIVDFVEHMLNKKSTSVNQ